MEKNRSRFFLHPSKRHQTALPGQPADDCQLQTILQFMMPIADSEKNRILKVNHQPLVSQVIRAIRADIMKGEYAPGDRRVETTLACRYGISRPVTREALQALERQGLVVSARLLHEEPRDFLQLEERETVIRRSIWQIADEPVLVGYLERLIWPTLKVVLMGEARPDNEKLRRYGRQFGRGETRSREDS